MCVLHPLFVQRRRQYPVILTVDRLVYSVTASSTLPSVPVLFGYYKSAENVSFKKTMGSSKQLSEGLKNRIIKFYKDGEGYKKLSSRLNIPVSTVRNIVKKWQERGTVKVKSRCGRPRKISERQMRSLVRNVTVKPQTTSKDLQQHLAGMGVQVHRSTVQRALHQNELHGRVMRKKPFLRPQHKQNRLKFAKEHIDKPDAFWNNILWTDETKIELFGHNHKRYA